MTPEGKVVAYLKKKAKAAGLEYRKLHYEGRRGCPDALLYGARVIAFVECKSDAGKPTREQEAELRRLEATPAVVRIVHNSAEVDELITVLEERMNGVCTKAVSEEDH